MSPLLSEAAFVWVNSFEMISFFYGYWTRRCKSWQMMGLGRVCSDSWVESPIFFSCFLWVNISHRANPLIVAIFLCSNSTLADSGRARGISPLLSIRFVPTRHWCIAHKYFSGPARSELKTKEFNRSSNIIIAVENLCYWLLEALNLTSTCTSVNMTYCKCTCIHISCFVTSSCSKSGPQVHT